MEDIKAFSTKMACGIALNLFLSGPSMADELDTALTANVALSTDYIFRFVSQTMEEPALSGGIDWDSGSGFYLGVWGSNVDFGDDAHLEIDFYGGYAHEFNSVWSVNTGLIDYEYYDDQSNENILEVFGSVSYGPANLGVYYEIEDGDYYWIEGSVEHEFDPLTVVLSAGILEPDEGDGYTGWSLGVGRSVGGFDFSLTWSGTNSKGEALFGRMADDRLVFRVSIQL